MSVIRNPVLTLAWGLPAVAVVASVMSLLVAIRTPESELPEQYHWEGFQLDRDFSQAAKATGLKVRATLSGFGAGGQCELALRVDGAAPDALELFVAHATQPKLDQRVTFVRQAGGAPAHDTRPGIAQAAGGEWTDTARRYSGACEPAPDSHWRVELVDAKSGWAVRQTVRGSLDGAALDAVSGTNE
jgi:hypothetical protein